MDQKVMRDQEDVLDTVGMEQVDMDTNNRNRRMSGSAVEICKEVVCGNESAVRKGSIATRLPQAQLGRQCSQKLRLKSVKQDNNSNFDVID